MSSKKKELTTEDAPDSIAPWEMLDDDGMAQVKTKLLKNYPSLNLAPVAKRIDNDLRACFDKGVDGNGKHIVVVHESGDGLVKTYNGFVDWFDEAVSESRK